MLNTRILQVLPVKEMLSGLNFQPTELPPFELSFQTGKERAFSATELAMVTSGQQRKCDNQRNCERDNDHSRTRFQSYF